MGRPFKVEIAESEEYLHKSLRYARTPIEKEKLQMLWWLKSGQVLQHKQLSERLGRNGSTITRWLQVYRQGGLPALLEVKKAPGKRPSIEGEMLAALWERLETESGFQSYREIYEWLVAEWNYQGTYTTVHKTVRYRLKAKLKVPRPQSTKQDKEVVSHFKKKYRKR